MAVLREGGSGSHSEVKIAQLCLILCNAHGLTPVLADLRLRPHPHSPVKREHSGLYQDATTSFCSRADTRRTSGGHEDMASLLPRSDLQISQ